MNTKNGMGVMAMILAATTPSIVEMHKNWREKPEVRPWLLLWIFLLLTLLVIAFKR